MRDQALLARELIVQTGEEEKKIRVHGEIFSRVRMKTMAKKFTVGLVQMKCTTNKEENLTHASEKIREAAKRGAQIICLHELFAGEYFCRTEDAELFGLAEAIPGPTTDRFAQIAKENKVAL